MPENLYETFDPNGDGHTFSFDEKSIRDMAAENGGYPVYTHKTRIFFHDLADHAARGISTEHISKRELAELLAELYKV